MVPNMTPDQLAEFERQFNRLNARPQIVAAPVADFAGALVSTRLSEPVFACETLAGWTGWRLPAEHRVLPADMIAAHRTSEHREMVAVIVSGRPTPGFVEGDDAVEVFGATELAAQCVGCPFRYGPMRNSSWLPACSLTNSIIFAATASRNTDPAMPACSASSWSPIA